MGKTVEIERVAVLVQIDSRVHQVALSQDKLRLLMNLAASLSATGELPLVKADETLRFA